MLAYQRRMYPSSSSHAAVTPVVTTPTTSPTTILQNTDNASASPPMTAASIPTTDPVPSAIAMANELRVAFIWGPSIPASPLNVQRYVEQRLRLLVEPFAELEHPGLVPGELGLQLVKGGLDRHGLPLQVVSYSRHSTPPSVSSGTHTTSERH